MTMRFRNLGRSGIRLGEIGIALSFDRTSTSSDAQACVFDALDLGVNYVDVARTDDGGEIERLLGQILDPIPRSDYVLASRVGKSMGSRVNDRGLSRKHIYESLHSTLRRLRTDYLDLYLCEGFDTQTPIEETIRTMDDLVRHGKIMYWGTSHWNAEQIADACDFAANHGFYGPSAHQPTYNLSDRSVEFEVLPVCRRYGLGVIPSKPISLGILDDYEMDRSVTHATHPLSSKSAEQLIALSHSLGLTLRQLAILWCLRLREVTCVSLETGSPSLVRESSAGIEHSLTPEDCLEIERCLSSPP